MAAAGLPRARFHDLRHSFVSWAYAEGVDIETISKLVGHSSTAVKRQVYLTSFESKKVEAAATMERLFAASGAAR